MMNRILAILLLTALPAMSQTYCMVTGHLSRALSTAYTNMTLTFTPQSTPLIDNPLLVSGASVTTTSTAPVGYFSVNLEHGIYRVQIGALPRDVFTVTIPPSVNETNHISTYITSGATTNFVPGDVTGWTKTAADSRYVKITNGVAVLTVLSNNAATIGWVPTATNAQGGWHWAAQTGGSGESTTVSSLGVTNSTTFPITVGLVGTDIPFKTFRAGANMVITNEGTNLIFASTASGSGGGASTNANQFGAAGAVLSLKDGLYLTNLMNWSNAYVDVNLAVSNGIWSPLLTNTAGIYYTFQAGDGAAYLQSDGLLVRNPNVSALEQGYLDGVTSGIQAQLDARIPIIGGGATNLTGTNFTVKELFKLPGFNATTTYVWTCTNATTGAGEWQVAPGAGGGITSLNAQTGATQTFATSGNSNWFTISSAGNVHTFNLPTAAVNISGVLSSNDWSTFNGKATEAFVYSIGANLTNFGWTLGANATSHVYAIGANSTNFAYGLGANATNFTYGIGANNTNFAYTIGANATSFVYSIGANTTNYASARQGGNSSLSNIAGITFAQGDIIYHDGSALVKLAAGTSNQFLKTFGAGLNPAWATPAGSGDVVGPSSAQDNFLPRFDGTTGKAIQDSLTMINDQGGMSIGNTPALGTNKLQVLNTNGTVAWAISSNGTMTVNGDGTAAGSIALFDIAGTPVPLWFVSPDSNPISITNVLNIATNGAAAGQALVIHSADAARTKLVWTNKTATAGSGTMTTVKTNGTQLGGADIVTLDYLLADFTLTESPDTEINITIASDITRDTELYGVGANTTNFTYSIGANLTNFTYSIGANATSHVYAIGANNTNFTYSIGANNTNFTYSIGANLTNFGWTIGANATSHVYSIGANSTNFTYSIGANNTNFTYSIGDNLTNHVASTVTNAYRVIAGSGGITVTNNFVNGQFVYGINDDDAGGGTIGKGVTLTNAYSQLDTNGLASNSVANILQASSAAAEFSNYEFWDNFERTNTTIASQLGTSPSGHTWFTNGNDSRLTFLTNGYVIAYITPADPPGNHTNNNKTYQHIMTKLAPDVMGARINWQDTVGENNGAITLANSRNVTTNTSSELSLTTMIHFNVSRGTATTIISTNGLGASETLFSKTFDVFPGEDTAEQYPVEMRFLGNGIMSFRAGGFTTNVWHRWTEDARGTNMYWQLSSAADTTNTESIVRMHSAYAGSGFQLPSANTNQFTYATPGATYSISSGALMTNVSIRVGPLLPALTANRAAYIDAQGHLTNSAGVDSTELESLDGVTSPIQTQFSNKIETNINSNFGTNWIWDTADVGTPDSADRMPILDVSAGVRKYVTAGSLIGAGANGPGMLDFSTNQFTTNALVHLKDGVLITNGILYTATNSGQFLVGGTIYGSGGIQTVNSLVTGIATNGGVWATGASTFEDNIIVDNSTVTIRDNSSLVMDSTSLIHALAAVNIGGVLTVTNQSTVRTNLLIDGVIGTAYDSSLRINSTNVGAYFMLSVDENLSRSNKFIMDIGAPAAGHELVAHSVSGNVTVMTNLAPRYRTHYINSGAMMTNSSQTDVYIGANFTTVQGNTPTNRVSDYYVFSDAITNAAQYEMVMPEEWDLGTLKFKFDWTTTNGIANQTNVWAVQATAYSNDDPQDANWGTVQTVKQTVTAANDRMLTAATPAVTVAGTPAAGDVVSFRFMRYGASAEDAMSSGQARLRGVWIQYLESATRPAAW